MAKENVAKTAFMICRNFSINGGMLARNGIVQGLPLGQDEPVGGGTVAQGDTAFRPKSPASSEAESHAITSAPSVQETEATSIAASSALSQRGTPSNPKRERPRARTESQLETATKATPSRINSTDLSDALKAQDYNRTQWLLENHFQTVANGEYAWLPELRRLGYSALDITDELMEKSINGPWIFEPFEVPVLPTLRPGYHQIGCVHDPIMAMVNSPYFTRNTKTDPRPEDNVLLQVS
jgi:hypothetical protein